MDLPVAPALGEDMPAVLADIVEPAQDPILAPEHENPLIQDRGRHIVAGTPEIFEMGSELPSLEPYLMFFALEDPGIPLVVAGKGYRMFRVGAEADVVSGVGRGKGHR